MNEVDFIAGYFRAEKAQALVFIAVGVAAIALAIGLLRRRSAWRGMAVPLVAVALIEIGVGATVAWRSDAQSAALQQLYRQDQAAFQRVETPRLKAVIASFELYKAVELGLLALGMAMVVLLRNREYGLAFGFGLVLQAGALLALDFFAEARADGYLRAVLGA